MGFKKRVLEVVRRIPRGSVLSYSEVARRAGNPGAARAVGMVMSRNRNPRVPCHRVIKADGTLGSYNRGGITEKKRRLEAESAL